MPITKQKEENSHLVDQTAQFINKLDLSKEAKFNITKKILAALITGRVVSMKLNYFHGMVLLKFLRERGVKCMLIPTKEKGMVELVINKELAPHTLSSFIKPKKRNEHKEYNALRKPALLHRSATWRRDIVVFKLVKQLPVTSLRKEYGRLKTDKERMAFLLFLKNRALARWFKHGGTIDAYNRKPYDITYRAVYHYLLSLAHHEHHMREVLRTFNQRNERAKNMLYLFEKHCFNTLRSIVNQRSFREQIYIGAYFFFFEHPMKTRRALLGFRELNRAVFQMENLAKRLIDARGDGNGWLSPRNAPNKQVSDAQIGAFVFGSFFTQTFTHVPASLLLAIALHESNLRQHVFSQNGTGPMQLTKKSMLTYAVQKDVRRMFNNKFPHAKVVFPARSQYMAYENIIISLYIGAETIALKAAELKISIPPKTKELAQKLAESYNGSSLKSAYGKDVATLYERLSRWA